MMSAPELYDANSLHDAMSVSSTCIEVPKYSSQIKCAGYLLTTIDEPPESIHALCRMSYVPRGVSLVRRSAQGFVGLSRHWFPALFAKCIGAWRLGTSRDFGFIFSNPIHEACMTSYDGVTNVILFLSNSRAGNQQDGFSRENEISFCDRYAGWIIFSLCAFLFLIFLTRLLAASSIGSRN